MLFEPEISRICSLRTGSATNYCAYTGSPESIDADSAQQTTALALPKDFGRFTGDWDQIVKRGYLRVLVVYSKSGFFYDKGRPRGAIAEYMEEFENVINKELKTSATKFKVVYLPMSPGQLQEALNGGIGDIACTGIIKQAVKAN